MGDIEMFSVVFHCLVTPDGAHLIISYPDTDTMKISCLSWNLASEINDGFLMHLSRRVFDLKEIAELKYNKEAELKDLTLKQRATVTGIADDHNVQGSFLQVVLRPVICNDYGEYYCAITFFKSSSASGVVTVTDSKNTTLRSKYILICSRSLQQFVVPINRL